MSAPVEWPPRCPECGEIVEVEGDVRDHFGDPDDIGAAAPLYHPECVAAMTRNFFERREGVRVFMYPQGTTGPLARDDPGSAA